MTVASAKPALFDDAYARGLLWAPWRMLESDHNDINEDVEALEKSLKNMTPGRVSVEHITEARAFMDRLDQKLSTHFHAEEKVVFPYLRNYSPGIAPVLQALMEEHGEIRARMTAWRRLIAKPWRRTSAHKNVRQGLELARYMRDHALKEKLLMKRFAR